MKEDCYLVLFAAKETRRRRGSRLLDIDRKEGNREDVVAEDWGSVGIVLIVAGEAKGLGFFGLQQKARASIGRIQPHRGDPSSCTNLGVSFSYAREEGRTWIHLFGEEIHLQEREVGSEQGEGGGSLDICHGFENNGYIRSKWGCANKQLPKSRKVFQIRLQVFALFLKRT